MQENGHSENTENLQGIILYILTQIWNTQNLQHTATLTHRFIWSCCCWQFTNALSC